MPSSSTQGPSSLWGRFLARPLWVRTLVLSTSHFVVMIGMLLTSLMSAGGIDAQEPLLPEPIHAALGLLTAALMQPGLFLWNQLETSAHPADALEWALLVANSLLWGLVLAGVTGSWRSRPLR